MAQGVKPDLEGWCEGQWRQAGESSLDILRHWQLLCCKHCWRRCECFLGEGGPLSELYSLHRSHPLCFKPRKDLNIHISMDYTYPYTYRDGSPWRSYFSSKLIRFHHPLYLPIFSLKVKVKIHFLMVLKAFHALCHSWATQGVQNQVLHTLLKALLTVTGHSCKALHWLFTGAHLEETENWFPMVPLIEMQTSPSGHQEIRAVLLLLPLLGFLPNHEKLMDLPHSSEII